MDLKYWFEFCFWIIYKPDTETTQIWSKKGSIDFKSFALKFPAGWIVFDLKVPELNKAIWALQAVKTISQTRSPKFVSSVLIFYKKNLNYKIC